MNAATHVQRANLTQILHKSRFSQHAHFILDRTCLHAKEVLHETPYNPISARESAVIAANSKTTFEMRP